MNRAVQDVCMPCNQSAAFLYQKPDRWDEYLDLAIPIFISHSCGPWPDLLEQLSLAGLSNRLSIRLVEESGRVRPVQVTGGYWQPEPSEKEWTLVLNWTHTDEGWRARLPLAGRSYIVTREKRQGQEFSERLCQLGALVEHIPTIAFQPPDSSLLLQNALAELPSFHWILFTSPNGVRFFYQRMEEAQLDHRALSQVQFACVGPKTAKVLEEYGFRCDLQADNFVAEGLLKSLQERLGNTIENVRILLPRAQEAREILPDTLREWGADVHVAPVYKTVPSPIPDDLKARITPQTRVLFTSASTVKNWVNGTGLRTLPCFCIGPVTEEAARKAGLTVLGVAPVHTLNGLVEEICGMDSQSTG
jgi:uroporphyrinogen-III synthase